MNMNVLRGPMTIVFSLLLLGIASEKICVNREYDFEHQLKVFTEDELPFVDLQKSSYIGLIDDFFEESEATKLMEDMHASLPWDWTYYKINGTQIRGPRKMAWFADGPDWNYMFSLNHVPGIPVSEWTPTLLSIREKIADKTGIDFNSVLANLYEEPQEHSAWHSDDDPWLGYPEPSDIVSISFGEAREFQFRPKHDKNDVQSIVLKHGSLGVMGGSFQEYYQHSVPGVKTQKNYRINLTFRRILYPERKPLKAYWHS